TTAQYKGSEKFCCFVWAQSECELDIAKRCNITFADRLEWVTGNEFDQFCKPYVTRYSYRTEKLNKCFMLDTANANSILYWAGFGTVLVFLVQADLKDYSICVSDAFHSLFQFYSTALPRFSMMITNNNAIFNKE
ncbi:hypothetical protein BLA29_010414, partial [Euroglyphus maynei]